MILFLFGIVMSFLSVAHLTCKPAEEGKIAYFTCLDGNSSATDIFWKQGDVIVGHCRNSTCTSTSTYGVDRTNGMSTLVIPRVSRKGNQSHETLFSCVKDQPDGETLFTCKLEVYVLPQRMPTCISNVTMNPDKTGLVDARCEVTNVYPPAVCHFFIKLASQSEYTRVDDVVYNSTITHTNPTLYRTTCETWYPFRNIEHGTACFYVKVHPDISVNHDEESHEPKSIVIGSAVQNLTLGHVQLTIEIDLGDSWMVFSIVLVVVFVIFCICCGMLKMFGCC
ncbi:uncharacterized protein LOC131947940 [Physella acuta]|uniref:uncharacterized protein LOC131947940 n=1 Tax=Physella acuta TaxID=109671 RepID=UPI0027DD6B02|nr:uncharacterized protein LOC131947940 [Physella acuta]